MKIKETIDIDVIHESGQGLKRVLKCRIVGE